MVWNDNNGVIHYVRSTDNGASVGTVLHLGSGDTPAIAAIGSTVHVVWSDGQIHYVRSTDGGNSFSNPIRIATSGFDPAISVSENNVHVVWESGSQGQSQYAGSTNNGDNFSIKNIGVGFNPDIAAVGDNVYIVGQGQGENTQAVFFTASTDDGSNFGKVEYVTTMGGSLPSVAAAS